MRLLNFLPTRHCARYCNPAMGRQVFFHCKSLGVGIKLFPMSQPLPPLPQSKQSWGGGSPLRFLEPQFSYQGVVLGKGRLSSKSQPACQQSSEVSHYHRQITICDNYHSLEVYGSFIKKKKTNQSLVALRLYLTYQVEWIVLFKKELGY